MGMGARWLVSFGLLVLPVAVTLGILFGLQARYEANGGKGSFTGPGDSGLGLTPNNDEVTFERSCKIATGLGDHRNWEGQEYILNPNQWNVKKEEDSRLCMDILWHNNGSYTPKNSAPPFQATWQYNQIAGVYVQAFPNAAIVDVFPKKIQDVGSINVDVEWTYANGNENKTTSDVELTESSVLNANVAVDMFIDSDEKTSKNSVKAAFEIMVWIARMGPATQPNDNGKGVLKTVTLQGSNEEYTFELYYGSNPTKQDVFTWISTKPLEEFDGDVYKLVEEVINFDETDATRQGAPAWPTASDYIGYLSMGTEAYHSPENVTFYVPHLVVDVQNA